MSSVARPIAPNDAESGTRHAIPPALALLVPIAAAALQWALWDYLKPLAWFLFYPATFLASWIGGRLYGCLASLLSAALVLWIFFPPEWQLTTDPKAYVIAAVFVATGCLIAEVHARLQEARRDFRGLLDLQSDVYWRLDAAGTVVEISLTLPIVEGLGTGQKLLDVLVPRCATAEVEALRAALASGERFRKLRLHSRTWPARGSFEAVFSGEPIRNADGQLAGWHGTITDVTREEQLERQLRQKQKLESVGQLTGGLAHDFNNLLTVIMGNAEALLDALAERPGLQVLAQTIIDAAQRGADLTRRLLSFAREQPLVAVPVDVNVLVREMKPLLRRTIPESVNITRIADDDLKPALVDPSQLENAILNLCLNARDAMPHGGQISIRLQNATLDEAYASEHADARAGEYVCITVSDTGCGIAPEHMARVFEPFFTTKDVSAGTGLGLSMVYGLAKQSNGHAAIYSEVGYGTVVRLYLPVAAGQVSTGAVAATAIPDEKPIKGDGETVLLVEDEASLREFAERQLCSLGYRVLTAADARSALQILQDEPSIDLLFTDVVMPGGMSGADLARSARALRPTLRLLYTSGYTDNAILDHAGVRDAALVLPKPYLRDQLARMVRQALDTTLEASR